MRFSNEPTRELLFCTTAESEILLHKNLQKLPGWEGVAARSAIAHPFRIFAHDGGFMRFWNWDASNDPEHVVVDVLLHFIAALPGNQYRLLRITCDDNELEEAGNSGLFHHMGIRIIQAPRIIF